MAGVSGGGTGSTSYKVDEKDRCGREVYAVEGECLVRDARRQIGSVDIGAGRHVPGHCCLLRGIIQMKESHGPSITVGWWFNLVTVGVFVLVSILLV